MAFDYPSKMLALSILTGKGGKGRGELRQGKGTPSLGLRGELHGRRARELAQLDPLRQMRGMLEVL